jgi:4-azaleucine resistance transporter AzlC
MRTLEPGVGECRGFGWLWDAKAELRDGFVATLPLSIGTVPFGIAFALAAQTAGLSAAQTLAMSLLVYAGASQLVAAELLATGASSPSILLATLVVNVRHLPLAASLAAPLRRLHPLVRATLAFSLSDPSYAVSVERVLQRASGAAFLFGSGLSLYLFWALGTIAGLLLGGVVADPTAWGLELVFPLSFMVLVMPHLRSRPGLMAAVVAAALALGGRLLIPGNWYILLATIGGSLAGALLEGDR